MNSGLVAQAMHAQAQAMHAQEYRDAIAAPSDRETASIRDRATNQAAAIFEMAENVRQFADSLFGPVPIPANAPSMQPNGVTREPPIIESIRHAQSNVDDAIESLRRELARIANL